MQIDHAYNAHNDKTKRVEYFDLDGKLVVSYPFISFARWCDAEYSELDEKEVDNLIDRDWVRLTTDYFNHINPNEFQSKNSNNKTLSQIR